MPVPSQPGEKWKLVEGTEDYYISNQGRVKRGQKLLKQSADKDGYLTRSRNTQMAHEDNLIQRTDILVVDNENNMTLYRTQKDAAVATGADVKAVNNVIKGVFSQTKGYRFLRCKSFEDKRGLEDKR